MRTDARARRQRIIVSACELFRTYHPSEVSLELVADRAEVGIATLYRNFADRNALMMACAAHLLGSVLDIQQEALRDFAHDPEGAWYSYIRSVVDLGLGPLVPALAPDSLSDLPVEVAAARAKAQDFGARLLDQARDAGLVSGSLTETEFMAGLIVVTRPPIKGVTEMDPAVTERLVALYLSGVRHGGGSGWDERVTARERTR